MKLRTRVVWSALVVALFALSAENVSAQVRYHGVDGWSPLGSPKSFQAKKHYSVTVERAPAINRVGNRKKTTVRSKAVRPQRNRTVAKPSFTKRVPKRASRLEHLERMATAAPAADLKGEKQSKDPMQLVVSLPDQRVVVYQGDKRVAVSRVSTGRSSHPTPSGIFSILQKSRIHHSNLYESAPMPYMQRITWSGVALHAGNVSRPYASHGCIRMPYSFAKSLYSSTRVGAHVVIASGNAAPHPIVDDNLLQPLPEGAGTEDIGQATSASPNNHGELTEADRFTDVPVLSDFVPPVEAAVNALDESKVELAKAEARVPETETQLAAATQLVKDRHVALKTAGAIAAEKNGILRKAQAAVRNARRAVMLKGKELEKAISSADWSRQVVEKRRDDPRFEGEWMRGALARLAEKEVLVTKLQGEVAEVSAALTSENDARATAELQANSAVEQVNFRKEKLQDANERLRQARAEVVRSKKDVQAAVKHVRRATNALKISQARAKMPLRILITPYRGNEKVKNVQRLLADLGYDPGPADGVAGRNTAAAIKAFERDMERPETGRVTDELIAELYHRSGREQVANAHMYVRQGFLDLFDVPIEIKAPEKPLGTHLLTAMYFEEGATSTEWTALTVSDHKRVASNKSRKRKKDTAEETVPVAVTAKEALDRISIPAYARRQLSLMLTPGSSIVISDKGISNETGRGTDFVVLLR